MNTTKITYFLDKVVTVLTVITAKTFPGDEVGQFQHAQHFTGRLKAITEHQLWLEHLIDKTQSLIFLEHVVGIFEEREVAEDHPEVIRAKQMDDQRKTPNSNKSPSFKDKNSDLIQLNLDKVLSLGKV
jgi:hypothetical protein